MNFFRYSENVIFLIIDRITFKNKKAIIFYKYILDLLWNR